MAKRRLPRAAQNPVAGAIRRAIGAGPNDLVVVQSRPRDRAPGEPIAKPPPIGSAGFERLRSKTPAELRELGCGCWDGGLFLFPREWYTAIPAGFQVETINGRIEKFEPGVTSNDVGFGCLAYGVRIGPPLDDDD